MLGFHGISFFPISALDPAVTTLAIDTPGSVTIAGQDLDLSLVTVLSIDTPGAVSVAGQTLDFSITIGLLVDAGSVTISGQDVLLTISEIYSARSTGPLYINHRNGRPAAFWKGRTR